MNTTFSRALVAAGLLSVAGCEAGPLSPEWDIEVFFPLRFPDVLLQDHAPGNLLPPVDVSFTAAVESEDISDATAEILDQDIDQIRAQFIFATPTNIRGSLDLSFAPVQGDLFSTDPNRAVTLTIPLRQTTGDTTEVTVATSLLTQANVIFLQSRGTVRSGTGSILTIGPNDVLQLRVNLTATVPLVQ